MLQTAQEVEHIFADIRSLIEDGDRAAAARMMAQLQPDRLPRHLLAVADRCTRELKDVLQRSGAAATAANAFGLQQLGFIVGTGRCGTTILASLLNAHSKICVPPELSFLVNCYGKDMLFEKAVSGEMATYTAEDFVRLIGDFCPFELGGFIDLKSHFARKTYPQLSAARVAREFFDEICRNQGKQVLIEQTTWYGLELHSIRKMFPDMKVIHVVRDARDVALSATRTGWWQMGFYENLERWGREVDTIHRFGQDYPRQFLEIRYENLIADAPRELSRILGMFGLAFESGMLDGDNIIDYFDLLKEDMSQRHSPGYRKWKKSGGEKSGRVLFSDSVFAWKKSSEYDFTKMLPSVREALQRYGYST